MDLCFHLPGLRLLSPSSDFDRAWISIDAAFRLLGLRVTSAEHRRVWERYVSPLVRYAVRENRLWLEGRGPYRVLEDCNLGGYPATELLLKRRDSLRFQVQAYYQTLGRNRPLEEKDLELPFTDAPGSYRLSAADCQRILTGHGSPWLPKGSPFLFDQLAWTAWRVGTHQVISIAVPPGAAFADKMLAPKPDLALDTHYGKEATLGQYYEFLAPCFPRLLSPLGVKPDWRLHEIFEAQRTHEVESDLLSRPTYGPLVESRRIILLEEAWVIRERRGKPMTAAPIFVPLDARFLPGPFSDPWWHEHNVSGLMKVEASVSNGHAAETNSLLRSDPLYFDSEESMAWALPVADEQADGAVSAGDGFWRLRGERGPGPGRIRKPIQPCDHLSTLLSVAKKVQRLLVRQRHGYVLLSMEGRCFECGSAIAKLHGGRGRNPILCLDCQEKAEAIKKNRQNHSNRRRFQL